MLATAAGAPLVAARDYMLSFEDAAGNQVTSIVEPGAYTAVFSAHGRGTFGEQRVTFEVVKAAPADTAALAEAVASCDELLKATRASADGSDVAPAEFWATQEVLDAFDGAISAARGVLDAPGSDQAAVDAAVQELEQARAAFDSARKPGTHAGESPVLQRFAGDTALETMSKATSQFEETGGIVVLATMEGYWDALTAAGIAGGAAAPVLMTSSDELSEQTAAELARLAPKRIVVCGGTAALSEAVSEQAAEAAGGADVVRCAGEDAVGTANDVFSKAPQVTGRAWSNTALLCTNAGYWDALAAAPLAYAKALPIFLTSDADTVAPETLEAMREGGIENVRIVGGEAAISRNVDSQLVKAGFQVGERLAGPSAVETSEQVADYGLNLGMAATYVGAATVGGYWDALAGAPLCGKRNGVLLLVSDVQHARESMFLQRHAKEVDTLLVFGGSSAVSEDAAQALLDAIKANR